MQDKSKGITATELQRIFQKEESLKRNFENGKRLEIQIPRENYASEEAETKKENEQGSNKAPKCETLDKEIEEIAKKIKLANENKMAKLRTAPAPPARIISFTQKSPNTVVKSESRTLPCDWPSIQGQFGWEEMDKISIPYLTRSGEKYLSLRMVKQRLLQKYDNWFTDEVRSCFSITALCATTSEAKLLNEINFRHCDTFYGQLEFTIADNIIRLDDVKEMCNFYNFCHLILIERVAVPHKKCGFIKIAAQNCVPYTWHEDKQYVPLFYFEGECKYLEERSLPLTGWDLAYLKLCCKIQGIRKTLFDGESVRVVELELVKKFFPPGTPFDETWPTHTSIDTLVLRPVPKLVLTKILQKDKSKETTVLNPVPVLQHSQETINTKVLNKEFSAATPVTQVVVTTTSKPTHLIQTAQAISRSGAITNNYKLYQPCPNTNTRPITSSISTVSSYNYQRNAAPVVLNSSLPKPVHIASSAPRPTGYQKNFGHVQNSTNVTNHQPNSVMGPGTILPGPVGCRTGSRVLKIAEVSFKNAYFIVRTQLENKFLNYCINMEPYLTVVLLVALEEVSIFFQFSLQSVINAVAVMHIDIFLPNKMQLKELEKFNMHHTKGLIKLGDFVDNLPQIRFILTSKP